MKKTILLSLAFGLMSITSFAQEEKEVTKFARNAGDMALVIDATPFLKYAADLVPFTGVPASTPTFETFQSNILGKYFLQDNRAIRVRLGVDFENSVTREYIIDDKDHFENPLSNEKIVDARRTTSCDVELGVGYEYRIGPRRGRLHGYAAAEVFFGLGQTRNTYKYGNEMTMANQTPSTTDFGDNNWAGGVRTVFSKTKGDVTYGVAGIVGAEFFVSPQIAVGGELRLELRQTHTGKTYRHTERWDALSNTYVKEEVLDNARDRELLLDDQFKNPIKVGVAPAANLYMSLYF